MRLIALAMLIAPMPALAQAQSSQGDMQAMGRWSQQLVAVQQPVIDAYARCASTVEAIGALLKVPASDRRPDRALHGRINDCLAEMKTAAAQAGAGFKAMGPMPASVERGLRIDSRAIMASSAAATDGMVRYLVDVQEALAAAEAGDEAGFAREWAEARKSAGSAVDAQIVILQSMQRAMPLQVHKIMLEIRLGISRIARAASVFDPAAGFATLEAELRHEARQVGAAGNQLRAAWGSQRAGLQRQVAADPRRAQLVSALDRAFSDIAEAADRVAAAPAQIAPGALGERELVGFLTTANEAEISILGAARSLASAMSQ